jgi:PEP-CTERM motif
MVRNRFQIQKGLAGGLLAGGLLAVMLAATPGALASEFIGGVEDTPGSSGIEKNGDFNDMIFELTGNVTMNAPGGVFSNLTSGVVNESETVFWDNHSGDGPDMNVGYCLLNEATCSLRGAPDGSLEYLAAQNGGSVNNVTFDATGTLTLELLGGITGDKEDTLGWYDLADPSVEHLLIASPDSAGFTVSFTPDGAFALYSSDGYGQVYSSLSSSNVGEGGDQEHFAFFIPGFIPGDPSGNDPPSSVPEPSTAVLTGLGAVLLGFGAFRKKQ